MKRFPFLIFLVIAIVDADSRMNAEGFDPGILEQIDQTIAEAIQEEMLPGAVLHLEAKGHTYRKAYGNRALKPRKEANTADTIYDVASLTKVMATAPSIMKLVERGQLALDQTVNSVLADFEGFGKKGITIRQLLTHTSGLQSGFPKDDRPGSYRKALIRIYESEPKIEPGTATIYSDLNFILLGEIVQKVSGESLASFARREIWAPARMWETGFRPEKNLRSRIAPTEKLGLSMLRGEVHDPTSRLMGGVTGHAGVFSDVDDVARFARMMLNGGILDGVQVLKGKTVAEMTRIHSGGRGLGFDLDSSLAELPRGKHFEIGKSYGHTGWTGTGMWVDPSREMLVVLLANRNHPRGGDVRQLRYDVATLAAEAGDKLKSRIQPRVLPRNGIDVLVQDDFRPLAGQKVGLITNHTGLSAEGETTIDILHGAKRVDLKALFGPEHGIRGKLDQPEISDGLDDKTGLPIYSLYGENRKPGAERLAGLDALVFDIQDIGCRFYTYISTMGLAMEAAAEQGLKFVVLDRVNPIGGKVVDGPVEVGVRKFTSHHPIAIQHGMTVGELALMFREELGLNLELTIVPVSHWNRSLRFDQTGLTWVNPSPNMRSLEAAILYPGIGLPEFTRLSVGRGTATPFEHVAAPYIDSEKFVGMLNQRKLPGVKFTPTQYTPSSSIFAGELCKGAAFEILERDTIRPIDIGLSIASILHETHPDYDLENLSKLLVHPETLEAVRAGKSLSEIRALWEGELANFKDRREKFLLYR
tara:strand:+ start:21833 stop:24106 length:2274 start_codon:yes stop_codon:yes gene_type:complete